VYRLFEPPKLIFFWPGLGTGRAMAGAMAAAARMNATELKDRIEP
jgi:hypothetical protein